MRHYYALTILLSAFLLFQVQPIIARLILPWFGGSAAVWTTCLLFFQFVLLLGYLYAHLLARWMRPRTQALLHAGLLGLSLVTLPFTPKESWKPVSPEAPTLQILVLLMITVGLPYFLLSATSPLLQAWYTRRGHSEKHGGKGPAFSEGSSPYQFYALSNAGSMSALISYPILVEPLLTTRQQLLSWSLGYIAFALLCGAVAVGSRQKAPAGGYGTAELRREDPGVRPGWRLHLLWVALAACSSALLLAVTNHLTQNVAAIPFLWLLPLCLYLMSFIVCFGARVWEWRKPFLPLPALAIGAMAVASTSLADELSTRVSIPLFAAGLFTCCIACHGELARLKPQPRYLTSFYLMISVGGALGGAFVAVLAPHLFRGYYELPIAIAGCALLALFLLYRDLRQPWWDPAWLVLLGLTIFLVLYLRQAVRESAKDSRLMVRNFYGVLQVSDTGDADQAVRTLTNGTIIHGQQFLDPRRHLVPTTYYSEKSGVGLAIRALQERSHLKVGIVGLGAGTLACYGRRGDEYQFYEINPLVERVARSQFAFLNDSRANARVILGDARLSMEREPKQDLDLLAVDAFSSDSIRSSPDFPVKVDACSIA